MELKTIKIIQHERAKDLQPIIDDRVLINQQAKIVTNRHKKLNGLQTSPNPEPSNLIQHYHMWS